MNKVNVKDFWFEACKEYPGIDPDAPYQVWFFGNTPEMAKQLADFVVNGKKRATASLVAVNKIQPENAPIDNGFSVVTDFEGNPLCVIQTAEIKEIPFLEVGFDFAAMEGEGDENIEDWRKGHREYFTKECKSLGFEFNESMLIACEKFKLLYKKK